MQSSIFILLLSILYSPILVACEYTPNKYADGDLQSMIEREYQFYDSIIENHTLLTLPYSARHPAEHIEDALAKKVEEHIRNFWDGRLILSRESQFYIVQALFNFFIAHKGKATNEIAEYFVHKNIYNPHMRNIILMLWQFIHQPSNFSLFSQEEIRAFYKKMEGFSQTLIDAYNLLPKFELPISHQEVRSVNLPLNEPQNNNFLANNPQ